MAEMLLFSCGADLGLAKNLAAALGTKIEESPSISKYNDGETKIEISQNVINRDVFVIQTTFLSSNCSILDVCFLANTLKAKAARSITAIIPYLWYGRHDGSANLVLKLLATSGIERVLTVDLHSKRLLKFTELKLKNISAAPLFVNLPLIRKLQNPVIVSPDIGGLERAQQFSKYLPNSNIAIINKQRSANNQIHATTIIGNIYNRNCIIVDDIIDTGKTLCAAAMALKQQGALKIYACCTHAILSGNAVQDLQNSSCNKIYVTDSINPTTKLIRLAKLKTRQIITYIPIAELLAKGLLLDY